MQSVKKFSDLKAGSTYTVLGFDGPINSNYGTNYVLKVSEANSDESFEIYSTNSIAEYITNVRPTKKFMFTVKLNEGDNKLYPIIDGYRKQRKFTMLD